MQSLAKALAIAVSYLDLRAVSEQQDCDVQALEAVMAELQPLSENEKKVLIDALSEIGRDDLIEGLGID